MHNLINLNNVCRRQVTESTDPEVKSDNIDLFAAGPRRPQVKPLQPVVVPSPTPSDLESSTVSKRSIEDMTSTSAIRNSKNELRAELMRLEAEKEQLEVDRQRIDDERVNFDFCLSL